jgi:DHA3 family tetracycline resistance protein-like MFS transporter
MSQVYRIDIIRLNPLQLVLVGTVLEASAFLFEIPTGVVADMRSRRLSVIIGIAMMGAAFILEGAVPFFLAVIISQIVWGIGYTFTSGADEAWIADEVDAKQLDVLYLRAAQVGQICSLAGIIASTLLGAMMLQLPIILGGILFLMLAVFLVRYMREEHFTPAPAEDRNTWGQMKHTFLEGIRFIRSKSVLRWIFVISLLYGLYSEGFDRLWTVQFMSTIGFPESINLKPAVWVGLINGMATVLSILAVEYLKRKMRKTGRLQNVWILTLINLLMVVTILLFGLSGNFSLGLSMYLMFFILRKTNQPIFDAWRNKHIKSEVRATVLSTYGQMDAFGQIIGGPVLGFIALKASVPAAIVVSGAILAPIVILLIRAAKEE